MALTDPAVTPLAAADLARARLKQREDAIRANAIKQGREAERKAIEVERASERAMHDGHIAGLKEAQGEHLKHAQKLYGKAAFREGGLVGIILGMAVASSLIAATYWVMKDAVILNTATQRVNYPAPPDLNESYVERDAATGEPIRRAP